MKTSGFTLLIVLVFMQILTILALDSLAQGALLSRAGFHQYQAGNLLHLAEGVLSQLEKQARVRHCQIAPMPAAHLANQSLFWWQTHACQQLIDKQVFYYTWERVGRDLCAVTKNNQMSVEFYRWSLFAVQRNTAVLLQSVVATSAPVKPTCQTPRVMVAGRQMYRQIK